MVGYLEGSRRSAASPGVAATGSVGGSGASAARRCCGCGARSWSARSHTCWGRTSPRHVRGHEDIRNGCCFTSPPATPGCSCEDASASAHHGACRAAPPQGKLCLIPARRAPASCVLRRFCRQLAALEPLRRIIGPRQPNSANSARSRRREPGKRPYPAKFRHSCAKPVCPRAARIFHDRGGRRRSRSKPPKPGRCHQWRPVAGRGAHASVEGCSSTTTMPRTRPGRDPLPWRTVVARHPCQGPVVATAPPTACPSIASNRCSKLRLGTFARNRVQPNGAAVDMLTGLRPSRTVRSDSSASSHEPKCPVATTPT